MRGFCLLVITLFVLTEPAFAQARFPYTAEAVSDRVNVRAGQNNNFESVAVLSKGTLVTVLDKKFKWYKVALPAGAKAYVKGGYVKLLTPEIGEVLVDRLNVRSAPNTEATTVGQLKQGQKFFVQKVDGEWVWIKPATGVYGWVNEALLSFKSDVPRAEAVPEPDVAAAVKAAEVRAGEARLAQKTALLKKLDDGLVECAGQLRKTEGGSAGYKIYREETPVCFVDGPQAVLEGFTGRVVRVQGRIKNVPADADVAVVSLLKISLAL
ncbi:MAG: SH3 domain-containing protein [Candidatus Omnitrophica bacterium]|nr:SH3 domain-containing protein [Candidatus Omnitrophota bacterium]